MVSKISASSQQQCGHNNPDSYSEHLSAESLIITRNTSEVIQMPPAHELTFGQFFSPHMLSMNYCPTKGGWSRPRIGPYAPIMLDPAAAVFHYAPALFEGMKCFKSPEGNPILWRPQENMARMKRSAQRISLPFPDEQELLALICELVKLDKDFIPSAPGTSLYIRPTLIGTRPSLGVKKSPEALLYVITSPAGVYFPTPVSLLATPKYVRSWPGGTGDSKLALNYASTFQPLEEAEALGYNQNLWLFGEERKLVEVGQMNIFILLRHDNDTLELVTPSLGEGTILPGITRKTVLALARNHVACDELIQGLPRNFDISEREITIYELMKAGENLLEIFGSGTAALIAPVSRVGFQEVENGKIQDIYVKGLREDGLGPIGEAFRSALMGRMNGTIASKWTYSA